MAMFTRTRAVFIFSVVALFMRQNSAHAFNNLSLMRIPCEKDCECYAYSWTAKDASQINDRFSVECIVWRYGLHGLTLPPIKSPATDFVYKDSDRNLTYKLNIQAARKVDITNQSLAMILQNRGITYVSFKTFNLKSMRFLHLVDLNFNMIEELQASTFNFPSNLKAISMANNNIGRVARNAFQGLCNLERLNLSHNSLKTLNLNMLIHVPSLRILDFSYNKLTTISQTWENLLSIKVLDLSYNKIGNLPWESLSQLLLLKKLGLRGNPWKCTCQMKGILRVKHKLLVGSQAVCQTPYKLSGVLLEDLNSDNFAYCSQNMPNENFPLYGTLEWIGVSPHLILFTVIFPVILNYYRLLLYYHRKEQIRMNEDALEGDQLRESDD